MTEREAVGIVGAMRPEPRAGRIQALARLREAHEGEQQARRAAQVAAQRMRELYEEAERLQREPEAKRPVDLGPILARAVEMASPLLESRRHHLSVDVVAAIAAPGPTP